MNFIKMTKQKPKNETTSLPIKKSTRRILAIRKAELNYQTYDDMLLAWAEKK